jgi:2-haloacid dehalogenase
VQTVLGFDVYGTLVDPAGTTEALRPYAGEQAGEFARIWREKQLEYTFRRALMQCYVDFSVCTRQALDYTARRFGVVLGEADIDGLMAGYRRLPAFPDAVEALPALRALGCRMYAFSNGRTEDVEAVLGHAGLLEQLDGVVSVDEQRSFKPNPAVYTYFLRRIGAHGDQAWLISGNPFDVIGAVAAGMRAAWVQRSPTTVFDPWEITPTVTVGGLADLAQTLNGR